MSDSNSMSWRPDAFARKWHALAQRRRQHLAELYQSGAWERYFTEDTLRTQMREATREVDRWSAMLDDQASVDGGQREAQATSPRAA